ncbi:MAG TPA: hypothetical protein VF809_01395, partial [Candidatus Saccharimonadales bacterium]
MAEFPQYPEDIPDPGSSGEPAEGGAEFKFTDGFGEDPEEAEGVVDPSYYMQGLEGTYNPMVPSDGWADDVEPSDFAPEEVRELPTALDLPAEDRAMLYDAIVELTTGAPIADDSTTRHHEWRMPRTLADEYGIEYDVRLVCDPVDFATGYPRVYGIEARMPMGAEEVIDPDDGSLVTYMAEQQSWVILTRDTDVPEGIDPGIYVQEESSIFVDCRRAVVDDAGKTTHVALTGRTEASPLTFDEVGNIIDAAMEALRRRVAGIPESPAEAPETIPPQELSVPERTVEDMPKQERDEALAALELFAQGGEEYDTDYGVSSEDGGVGLVGEEGFEREVPTELLAEEGIEYDEVRVRVYRAASPEDPYFVELT